MTWPDGVGRLIVDEVDSTNDLAAAQAKDGSGPLWVMARRQTASRGRRGRFWAFDEGNFAASYVTWVKRPVAELAQMSFVAALALYDALATVQGPDDLALKWPNDVLIAGAKVSGILLETVKKDGETGLVIGVGVNLAHAPLQDVLEQRALPATSLRAALGVTIAPEEFLNLLAPKLEYWQNTWLSKGFAPVRDAWLSRAMGLGAVITARLPGAEHVGVFADIDPSGSLVLQTKTARLVLPAADVYFAPSEGD